MIYNNFIFIHIPKTGGSSIRSSLEKDYNLIKNATKINLINLGYKNLNEKFENYNFLIHDFKDHLPFQLIQKTINNKLTFTFIRNPFSRMVSLFYECISNDLHLNNIGIDKNCSFEDFVNRITEKSYWFTIPMIDYIGKKNLNKIDFIGRFEDFENDILKLKKNIKISIKHHNYNNHVKSVMKFSDYRPYYKNELIIDKVKNYYEDDLQIFNYSFNNFLEFEKNKINLFKIFTKILKRKIINFI